MDLYPGCFADNRLQCRAVLTSKTDAIGVWLVSATHHSPEAAPGTAEGATPPPGGQSPPGPSAQQQQQQQHHQQQQAALKVEEQNYNAPGEPLHLWTRRWIRWGEARLGEGLKIARLVSSISCCSQFAPGSGVDSLTSCCL